MCHEQGHLCGPARLQARSPQETRQERVGCWLLHLIDTTPGQRAKGKETDSAVTPFSGWGIFGAQPREGWNVTVTRFTPQVMKHDALASSPGGRPRQWVPWLPWCRLLTPRLCATGKATFETLNIFRAMDQREFLNIDWD